MNTGQKKRQQEPIQVPAEIWRKIASYVARDKKKERDLITLLQLSKNSRLGTAQHFAEQENFKNLVSVAFTQHCLRKHKSGFEYFETLRAQPDSRYSYGNPDYVPYFCNFLPAFIALLSAFNSCNLKLPVDPQPYFYWAFNIPYNVTIPGRCKFVKLLLADNRVDPLAYNWFALKCSVYSGEENKRILKAMLTSRDIDVTADNYKLFKTAFSHSSNETIDMLLIDKRVDPISPYLLVYASRDRFSEYLEEFIKRGIPVDCLNNQPLVFAIKKGEEEAIHILLEHGAKIDTNCIIEAAYTNLSYIIEVVLEHSSIHIDDVIEICMNEPKLIGRALRMLVKCLKSNDAHPKRSLLNHVNDHYLELPEDMGDYSEDEWESDKALFKKFYFDHKNSEAGENMNLLPALAKDNLLSAFMKAIGDIEKNGTEALAIAARYGSTNIVSELMKKSSTLDPQKAIVTAITNSKKKVIPLLIASPNVDQKVRDVCSALLPHL
jgi:ankyrin repeat protein